MGNYCKEFDLSSNKTREVRHNESKYTMSKEMILEFIDNAIYEGKFEEALKVLNGTFYSGSSKLYIRHALLLAKLGEEDRALEEYKQIIENQSKKKLDDLELLMTYTYLLSLMYDVDKDISDNDPYIVKIKEIIAKNEVDIEAVKLMVSKFIVTLSRIKEIEKAKLLYRKSIEILGQSSYLMDKAYMDMLEIDISEIQLHEQFGNYIVNDKKRLSKVNKNK